VLLVSVACTAEFVRPAFADTYYVTNPNKVLRLGDLIKSWDSNGEQLAIEVPDPTTQPSFYEDAPAAFTGSVTTIKLTKSEERSEAHAHFDAHAELQNLVASASIDTGGDNSVTSNKTDLEFTYAYDDVGTPKRLKSDWVGKTSTLFANFKDQIAGMSPQDVTSKYGDLVVVGLATGRHIEAKLTFHFDSKYAAESFYANLSGSYSAVSIAAAMNQMKSESNSTVSLAIEAKSPNAGKGADFKDDFADTDASSLQVKMKSLEDWCKDQITNGNATNTVGYLVEPFTDFNAYPPGPANSGFPTQGDCEDFRSRLLKVLEWRRELERAGDTDWYTDAGDRRRKKLYQNADDLVNSMCKAYQEMDATKGKLYLPEFQKAYDDLDHGTRDVLPVIATRQNNRPAGAQVAKIMFGYVDFGRADFFQLEPATNIFFSIPGHPESLAYSGADTEALEKRFLNAEISYWPGTPYPFANYLTANKIDETPQAYFGEIYQEIKHRIDHELAKRVGVPPHTVFGIFKWGGTPARRMAVFYSTTEQAFSTLHQEGLDDNGDGMAIELLTKPSANGDTIPVVSKRCNENNF
jgi:hypothetical protein